MATVTSDPELRDNYLRWTKGSLAEMRAHMTALRDHPGDKALIDAIYGIAHNIKGMGASFGFPLMTETGMSLCRYLRALDGRAVNLEVVDAHVRSFEVVMNNQIEGHGGATGRELVDRLANLVDRSLAA
ncbi:MAG: Hpt domain-containing protein [Pseudomonadota bacterium]